MKNRSQNFKMFKNDNNVRKLVFIFNIFGMQKNLTKGNMLQKTLIFEKIINHLKIMKCRKMRRMLNKSP